MNLDYVDGLLFTHITLVHQGQTMLIPQVVIDTGATESIISIDAVSDWFHSYEPDDQIRFMNGIGGREAAVRRQIHQIEFHSFVMKGVRLDFGRIGEYSGIHGLIGLDILIPGKFIVNLDRLEIYTASNQ